MRFRLAVLVTLLCAASAHAQQLPGTQQAAPAQPFADPAVKTFEDYVNGKDYITRVHTMLMMEEKSLAPECKQPKVIGRAGFAVLRRPAFQTGIHPSTGAWKEHVRVDRCGKTIVHNLIAMAQPGAEPQIGLLFPGATAATPPLQREAVAAAGAEAIAKLGCKDNSVAVLDTAADKILVPLKADTSGLIVEGKWREIWTLRACKKVLPVAVEFTTNGKGGALVEATTKIEAAPKAKKP